MNEESPKKPMLIPVRAPWQISASAAYLRAQFSEAPNEIPVQVDFVGFFRGNEAKGDGSSGTALNVIKVPPVFEETKEGTNGVFQLVRVVFGKAHWLRLSPGVSESQVLDEAAYDWSAVPSSLGAGETVYENVQRVRALWLETGVCPDPRMYEVKFSPWLAELRLSQAEGWSHYLLAGSEGYLEVIAQGWEWRQGQAL
jgi:hypothetical protein